MQEEEEVPSYNLRVQPASINFSRVNVASLLTAAETEQEGKNCQSESVCVQSVCVFAEVSLAALLTTRRPSVLGSRMAQSVSTLSQRTICWWILSVCVCVHVSESVCGVCVYLFPQRVCPYVEEHPNI